METMKVDTYVNELKILGEWINSLHPIKDAKKIAKLQEIGDKLTRGLVEFLKEEETNKEFDWRVK